MKLIVFSVLLGLALGVPVPEGSPAPDPNADPNADPAVLYSYSRGLYGGNIYHLPWYGYGLGYGHYGLGHGLIYGRKKREATEEEDAEVPAGPNPDSKADPWYGYGYGYGLGWPHYSGYYGSRTLYGYRGYGGYYGGYYGHGYYGRKK